MQFPFQKNKEGWAALDERQRRGLGVAMLVQIGLLVFALQDWFRRSDDEIRGRKLLWLPALFVNFVGPISYLAWGRHGGETA